MTPKQPGDGDAKAKLYRFVLAANMPLDALAEFETAVRAEERERVIRPIEQWLKDFAEEELYDGDTDQGLPGYDRLWDYADRMILRASEASGV